MPDVHLFLKAFLSAASASTIFVLAFAVCRCGKDGSAPESRLSAAAILLSAAIGMVVGSWVLQVQWKWPPVNAMDRFRELILPVTVAVELLACWKMTPRPIVWALRGCVASGIGGVLFYGSAYVTRGAEILIPWQTWQILVSTLLSLIGVWLVLYKLAARPAAASIGIAVAMCLHTAGLVVMLAGYINGGAAAIPLGGALLAASVVTWIVAGTADVRGLISVAVVSLFGLLFIGRFFGNISTTQALVIFFAPLLCWVTEFPVIRRLPPFRIGVIRIVLVSIPLLIVLVLSTMDFDERMAPLIAGFGDQSEIVSLNHCDSAQLPCVSPGA